MTKEDLVDIMRELAQVRPVFHSEADFQHELGFLLRSKRHRVRLERPFKTPLKFELDLEVDGEIAIELKYKKARLKYTSDTELFDFISDGAFPDNRYKIINDAKRVRDLVDQKFHSEGFTIFLTNDKEYWCSDAKNTIAEQFDFTEGRKFAKGTSLSLVDSKAKKPKQQIDIRFNDIIEWQDYKNDTNKELEKLNNGLFRFFVIDVNQ
jgi:hypothetical protein